MSSHLGHGQLTLVLSNLLSQNVDLVSLASQLRPRLVLPSLGQLSLKQQTLIRIVLSDKFSVTTDQLTTDSIVLILIFPHLNILPGLPGLHSLVECVLDSTNYANVVMNQLGQKVEVILGLLFMNLLHLLLHISQLLESSCELGVVLGTAQQSQTLAELICLTRQTLPD